MENFFEISGEDIGQLNDTDLRELIARLCEEECRLKGFFPSGVLWGGNQDASDGGLDVVVTQPEKDRKGYLQRKRNGLQVKRPLMPRSEILKEMKPGGKLRDSIKKLIKEGGSYIIVSSQSSVSAKVYDARLAAIKEAISSEKGNTKLHIDFFDQGRVATWVRLHPSLVIWVRNKIGKSIQGWRPYENWTQPGNPVDEYIIDERSRLFDDTTASKAPLTIPEGLIALKQILSKFRTCVRLVGLSGVGKTRFVQAIFDGQPGHVTFSPLQVLYTDMATAPSPSPNVLIERLIAQRKRAIVVVDNCPPDLHRLLAVRCSGIDSMLSLITVEYDVREDLPEETKVFRLEPSSEQVISILLKRRFPQINEIDKRTIAEFSGGNTRIALSLATTVGKGDTLAGLPDAQLFERLFQQRNASNSDLMKSAQVLSLVYSFEGTDTISDKSELLFLGSLIGKTPNDLYMDVAELHSRDLVQERSIWRALLPHAIANRLAREALKMLPPAFLAEKFENCGSERLLRSFSRRVSFLHDNEAAVNISNAWLSKGGRLGNLNELNELAIDIFINIAPIAPFKTLEAIERTLQIDSNFSLSSSRHYHQFVEIVHSIAFDAMLFYRSAKVLVQFAAREKEQDINDPAAKSLKSMFRLYLSGTHATTQQRYEVIEKLLNDDDTKMKDLGFDLLKATIQDKDSTSTHRFSFGARTRDYGYQPKTLKDVTDWYDYFFDKFLLLIENNTTYKEKAKLAIADNFYGIWRRFRMDDLYDRLFQRIAATGSWYEGWVQVRKTLYFCKEKRTENALERLRGLEALLKPTSLQESIEAYVFTDFSQYYDYVEDWEAFDKKPSAMKARTEEITFKLGTQLAENSEVLKQMLPKLVSKAGSRVVDLGRGVATGAKQKEALWVQLKNQVTVTDETERKVVLLLGFVNGLAQLNYDKLDVLLDEILINPILSKWFPYFQVYAGITDKGMKRLYYVLEKDVTTVEMFHALTEFRDSITDKQLASLITKLLNKERGDVISLYLLSSFFNSRSSSVEYSDDIILAGCLFFEKFSFELDTAHRKSFHLLDEIARACLSTTIAAPQLPFIYRRITEAIADYKASVHDFPELFTILIEIDSSLFMDTFLEPHERHGHPIQILESIDTDRNPIGQIPKEKVISWCAIKPDDRFPLIINFIDPFVLTSDLNKLQWNPIVLFMLNQPGDKTKIFEELQESIRPNMWSGSLAEVLRERLSPVENLFSHLDMELVNWSKSVHRSLLENIDYEEENERQIGAHFAERFE